MKPTLRDNEISFSYIHFKNGSLPSLSQPLICKILMGNCSYKNNNNIEG